MQTSIKSAFVIGALLLGALGQSNATATSTSTSTSTTARAELQVAVLLDARGQVVGTIDQAGRITTTALTNTATHIKVTFTSGATMTFNLAQRLEQRGRVTFEGIVVKSGEARASLRQAIEAELRANAHLGVQVTQALHGKVVTLVTATGDVVGTFTANGSLQARGDVRQASKVLVTLQNGSKVSYDLASSFTTDGSAALTLGNVSVRDESRAVALVDVLLSFGQRTEARDPASPTTGTPTNGGSTNTGTGGNGSGNGGTGSPNPTPPNPGVGIGIGIGIGVGIGGK